MQAQGKTLSQRQHGAALIVSLIMLIMVSLLAAGGFLITTGEARSAANWSDRQRALFRAEDILVEAIETVDSLAKTKKGVDLQAAVKKASTGFYYEQDAFDATTGWPSGTTCNHSPAASTTNCYVIVFDGLAPPKGLGLASNAIPSQSTRFTFYAKAGGDRADTFVVLSTSRSFD